MKKKRFVTLFPYCTYSGITKGTGQTPMAMARYWGYKSYLVTYFKDACEAYREKYAPELNLIKIPRSFLGGVELRDS